MLRLHRHMLKPQQKFVTRRIGERAYQEAFLTNSTHLLMFRSLRNKTFSFPSEPLENVTLSEVHLKIVFLSQHILTTKLSPHFIQSPSIEKSVPVLSLCHNWWFKSIKYVLQTPKERNEITSYWTWDLNGRRTKKVVFENEMLMKTARWNLKLKQKKT